MPSFIIHDHTTAHCNHAMTNAQSNAPLQSHPDIHLREYRAQDRDPSFELVRDGWLQPFDTKTRPLVYAYIEDWVEQTLRPSFDDVAKSLHYANGGQMWVAENRHGVVIGTVGVSVTDAEVAELVRLSVASTLRGRGIGSFLLRHAVAYAKSLGLRTLWLETMDLMRPACKMYERQGFVRFGRPIPHGRPGTHDFGHDVYYRLLLR